MNPLSINGVTVELLKDNWMLATYEQNCLLNATILEELRIIYTELNGNDDLRNLRLLQVFKGNIAVSRDIGERYLIGRIRPKIGEALVALEPNAREYLTGASVIMRRTHPVKVFDNKRDAEMWLESL